MKTIIKKIFLILIVLSLSLVMSPLSVFADDDPTDPTDPDVVEPLDKNVSARVTFTNAPTHQPDLYVTKRVTTDSPDTEIPDATFNFQIKIDGEAYGKKKYSVLDADSGSPVLDSNNVPITGYTSDSGAFSLKAKQTAYFEYVGKDKNFEITEVGTIDGFECIEPATGVSTGTLTKDGATSNFVNFYTPPSIIPGTKYGSLNVRKQLSMPYGYKVEGAEDALFTFVLTVNGQPVKDEKFDLKDIKTGSITSNYASTNVNGEFTIKADKMAMFKTLEYDGDYKVSEVTSSITPYRLVSENDKEGTTSKGNTEIFTNSLSSFIVTKVLSKGTSDDTFTFTLYKEGKVSWPGASYWLYSTDGTRLKNETTGLYETFTTDSNGQFTLKQNQAALFISIPEGTIYSVAEEPKEGYKQVFPSSVNGYEDYTVSKTGDTVLKFENEKKEGSASLSVTKKIIYENGVDAPLVAKSFDFVLMVKNSSDVFEPVANQIYTIGTDTTNYETGSYGSEFASGVFSLKQNETANFARLSLDKEYRVYEIIKDNSIPGYAISDTGMAYDSTLGYWYVNKNGLLEDGNPLSFTVSNIYTSKKLALQILKLDNSSSKNPLENAVFKLYKDEACTVEASTVEYTTDSEGLITIPEIKDGVYYIKEITPPDGFKVLPSPVKLTLTRTSKGAVEGFKASIDYDTSIMGMAELLVDEAFTDDSVLGCPLIKLAIKDDDAKIIALPSTGGIGIYAYMLIGATMITYGLIDKKRGSK